MVVAEQEANALPKDDCVRLLRIDAAPIGYFHYLQLTRFRVGCILMVTEGLVAFAIGITSATASSIFKWRKGHLQNGQRNKQNSDKIYWRRLLKATPWKKAFVLKVK